jgi:hypothetical protein
MGVRVREGGIALAAAVFALVALAALLAGLWFAALQEYRVGANLVRDRRAFDAAEAGLDAALAGWNAGALNRLDINDSVAFSGSLSGGSADYSGLVQRLGPWLFLIRSTGLDASGSSRRTLAVVARLVPLQLRVKAALVASGPVWIGAGAQVDALVADTGGACAGPSPTAVGVVLGDAADLVMSGCTGGSCLRGNPAWSVDTALRNSPVPLLGEGGWTSLMSVADTLGQGNVPSSASPVWYAPGDYSPPLETGAGPVVLLVQGDLVMETGARLSGLAVVRGRLIMRGAGGSFVGSVLAGGAELSALSGSQAGLVHSPCAVQQALLAAAPAMPLTERSWTALY